MAKRDVKGLHRVVSHGREYWYAWRGGPRVHGAYGTPDFWGSYDTAVRDRHVPEPGKFKSLVTLYRASPDYQKLADETKRIWGAWLDRVATHFGGLSIAAFDNPKVRPIIRQWRNQYAETPRTADTALQVLSRVCAHAVDPLGKLNVNPCEGIKALYTVDRSDKIWTEADIARIKQVCIPEIVHVIDLAAATGLRWGWSHVHDDAIAITTAKSRHRREAVIPLYDGLREILARIPKQLDHGTDQQLGPPVGPHRVCRNVQPSQERRRAR
jgi:hypothetical protein